ncbi:MAG TPA: hypothetical protein VIV55_06795 [Flavobacterium sp.]
MHLFKKAALLLVILITVSCNFTENLEVKPDGTGTFSLEMDGSGLMAMAGDQILGKMDGVKDAKSIDSTFTFKQILEEHKDSIAKLSPEKQAQLKKLENVVMHLKMNAEKNEFLITMNTPFKNVNELESLTGSLKSLNELKGKQEKSSMPIPTDDLFGDSNTKLSFTYNGKSFTRKAIVSKQEIKKVEVDSLGMAKMFFASSKYTLKYRFPKAVKNVSNPDALFSADKKTITIEYPFTDYTDNPEKLNLNVEFE